MKIKKIVFAAMTCSLVNVALFSSCSTPAEKLENAQDKLKEANQDMDKANQEYLIDVDNYRKETAAKIAANNQSIADFKARVENDKQDAKANYTAKVAALEQRNTDMQKKLDDYQLVGKEKWETFKTEFSHSMDDLGKSFKDLTVNTK